MDSISARFSTLVGVAALALGILMSAPAAFAVQPTPPPAFVEIDSINGVPPGEHCIAGTLTLVVHGTSGSQGGPYSIDVGNGFSTTTASDVVNGSSADFSDVAITYTPQEASTALYVFLYHGQPDGNDSHFTSVTQCVAPPTQGVVIVEKHVTNDDGGQLDPENFTLHIGNNDFAGDLAGTDNLLTAGPYTLSEDPVAGYEGTIGGDCAANGSISVVAGENYLCTITNDDTVPTTGTLTIIANAVGGGTPTFEFDVTGPTPSSPSVPTSGGTGTTGAMTVNTGTYAIAATFPADWVNTGISCDDGTSTVSGDTVSDITVAEDQDVACTFSGEKLATLTVIKHVENEGGGEAVASDFTMEVTGTSVSDPSFPGDESGTSVTLEAGAYSVSETDAGGYTESGSADCSGEIAPGEEKTCTITNTFIPTTGGLVVTKTTIGGDGTFDFTGDAGAFSITTVGGTGSEEISGLAPGSSYMVSETGQTGWDETSNDCEGLAIVAGATTTCTFVNTKRGSITVHKDVVAPDGTTDVADTHSFGITLDGSNPESVSESSDVVYDNLTPGDYTIGEDSDAAYDLVSGTGSVAVTAGENTDVTIVNKQHQASLTVIKHVVNNGLGTSTANAFTMEVTGTSVSDPSFPGAEDPGTTVTLDPGAYSVSESGPEGYGQSLSIDCSGSIGAGEEKTCTVINDNGAATLTIVKNALGLDRTFDFSVTGTLESVFSSAPSIETVAGVGTTTLALEEGSYDVVETVPAGWSFTGVSCLYDNESIGESITNGEAISVDPGDSVTCTFGNTAVEADLSIEKSVDDETPDSGQTITYTLTAANAGPADASGITVHDVLPAGLSYVSDDGSGAYESTTGDWTIPTLAGASSTALHIVAEVTAAAGETVTNIATISLEDEGVSDENPGNDSGEVSFTVNIPSTPLAPDERRLTGGGRAAPRGQVLGAATSTPQLGVTCGLYMDQYLRQGGPKNNPDQVTKLQQFLVKHGYGSFTPTGFFGPLTFASTKAFQSAYASTILTPWGISVPTGLAYLTTIRQLNLIECPDLMIPQPELVPWNLNPSVQ